MTMRFALPRRLSKLLRYTGMALAASAVAAVITIITMESRCSARLEAVTNPYSSALAPADRRDEVNTYLTYPEWSIVHAYEDLAGVMRRGSESDFGYFGSISGFWSSLCQIKRLASSRGKISFDYNSMLYTIGFSFTAEMGIKGLYEETIGAVTVWVRGATRTPEDDFALATAEEYAAFLRQVPWYDFPFGTKLKRFWVDTPLLGGNVIRKIERRVALTLEYGSKMIYARGIAALAGLIPAPLEIRSVAQDLGASDTAAEPRIKIVSTSPGAGAAVIQTPRYREFTDIMRGLAQRNRTFVEIAGNQRILVTIIARNPDFAIALSDQATMLLSVPIQTHPGWRRLGVDVKVPLLLEFIRSLPGQGAELEHVYDY